MENPHSDCKATGRFEFPQHWEPCNPAEDLATADAYRAAQNAAEIADVDELVALIPAVHDWIVVNQDRRAVQLLSCDGEKIVASFVLPELVFRRSEVLLLSQEPELRW